MSALRKNKQSSSYRNGILSQSAAAMRLRRVSGALISQKSLISNVKSKMEGSSFNEPEVSSRLSRQRCLCSKNIRKKSRDETMSYAKHSPAYRSAQTTRGQPESPVYINCIRRNVSAGPLHSFEVCAAPVFIAATGRTRISAEAVPRILGCDAQLALYGERLLWARTVGMSGNMLMLSAAQISCYV
ncbi:hypothetical protein HNY73_015628 [Argiope bruennichi]|uniref:Uncharacterized protein n=1 Tax=Argiope bruennichi TaxID=94029 RepID=A0A8T0EUM9_ARGBR|nr:hypothetical protein HNY73_015628 [Argiope bruennichi]